MEKEWRDYAFSHKQHFGRSADKNEIWSSFAKLIPSLLSAFAEEVIGKEEEILTAHELMTKNKSMNKSIADWEEGKQMGKSVLRAEQRLKAKEIISSIGK